MASGILRHLRNYSSAGLFAALAGVVSFPILTRSLDVAEYGLLGLITSSLTLVIAFGKLGVQHAVIRFFAEVKHGNSPFSLSHLHSTVFMVFLVLASAATGLWLLIGLQVLPQFLQSDAVGSLFIVASGTVFVRLMGSGVLNFLRAEQRSGDAALMQVLARFTHLGLLIGLLLWGTLEPWLVLVSLFIAEVVAVLFAATRYREAFEFNWRAVHAPLVRALLYYGLPLMILESLGLVLRLTDRYLIEALLGVNALGMYSASYNLTAYLEIIVLAGLAQAVRPMYVQLWESQSPAATVDFLARSFRLYLVVGIPFIALFSLLSPHLLSVLAGSRYMPGTVVIPAVATSFLLEGCMVFLGAGLYIKKNTRVLMVCGAAAAAFNISLNLLLIPHYGILGAAIVTVLSYVLFAIGVTVVAFRRLSFTLPVRDAALSAAGSVLLYLLLSGLHFDTALASLLVKGVIGSVVVVSTLMLLDRDVRSLFNQGVNRLAIRAGMR